jgi:hypothetical protein
VKRVVCEMGGKNAIIIDTRGSRRGRLAVRHSAFGFQGQKCSACSRVIVVDPDEGPRARDHQRSPPLRRGDPALVSATRPARAPTSARSSTPSQGQDRSATSSIGKARSRLELTLPMPAGLEERMRPAASFVGPHIFSACPGSHDRARRDLRPGRRDHARQGL